MSDVKRKIARKLAEADGHDWMKLSDEGRCGKWMTFADAVLDVPEIAEALRLVPVKPLNLGPSVSTGKRTPV